ncbi:MAG: hypothetical protein A2231_13140 [Candidatus Firestonebacteria bacterium RIFOXYA2_FULL_40_8]|nr:MAG: hypothetical protein A2231_13140 [Candidatus Firestonebacteria bacterium RIFOXYA2_FULL_40_8]
MFEDVFCDIHKEAKSIGVCSGCGKHLCTNCSRFFSGRTLCDVCLLKEKARSRGFTDNLRYSPKVIKKTDFTRTILKYSGRILFLGVLAYLVINFNGVVTAAVKYVPGVKLEAVTKSLQKINPYGDPEAVKKLTSQISGSLVVMQMNQFIGPLELSYQTGGGYPPDFEEYLRQNFETKDKSKPPEKDIWGTPYRLEIRDTGFAIISAGIDRQFGTTDDLTAPYKRRANTPIAAE